MPGALSTYAFINAKLRARLSKMIDDEQFDKLVRARSLSESIQLLGETGLSFAETVFSQTGDLRMVELELFAREVELHVEIRKYVSGEVRRFVDALAMRYEVDTLKNSLRLWFDRTMRGRGIEGSIGYLYRGIVHHEIDFDRIINAQGIEDIAKALSGTPYAEIVRANAERVRSGGTLFPVETALDRSYYGQLVEAADRLDRQDAAIARGVIAAQIDLQNINWIVRLKTFYDLPVEEALQNLIPFGRNVDSASVRSVYSGTGVSDLVSAVVEKRYAPLRAVLSSEAMREMSGLSLIERMLDEIMLVEVGRALSGYPFTVGIILAYFYLKQREIARIVTVLNAKFYNLDEDRVRSVL